MKLIKRHTGLLLLTGIICIPFLFTVYFLTAQTLIELEMELALQSNELQEISVKTTEITWLKKGKEVLINNQPFDIKSYKVTGLYTCFTGLFDKKEKELSKRILDFHTKNGIDNNYIPGYFQLMFICFYSQQSNTVLMNDCLFLKQKYEPRQLKIIPDRYLHTAAPPPRTV